MIIANVELYTTTSFFRARASKMRISRIPHTWHEPYGALWDAVRPSPYSLELHLKSKIHSLEENRSRHQKAAHKRERCKVETTLRVW